MKYTEEIFNILSKGGFISANSVSPAIKRYYDAIEEDLTDYYEYYKGIGFYLEGGDGYYMFTRQEAKVDLERKLEAVMKWIDYLSFLKTYDGLNKLNYGSGKSVSTFSSCFAHSMCRWRRISLYPSGHQVYRVFCTLPVWCGGSNLYHHRK